MSLMYVNRVGGCIYFYRKLNSNYSNINFIEKFEIKPLHDSVFTFSQPFFIHTVS